MPVAPVTKTVVTAVRNLGRLLRGPDPAYDLD
jgi:hypothetical protein